MRDIILIQGALDSEIDYYISKLENVNEVKVGSLVFYESEPMGIVVQKTNMGLVYATLATTLAIEKYAPRIVINQGTAGTHTESVKVGDIVVGEKAYNIHDMTTPNLPPGEGSHPENWRAHMKRGVSARPECVCEFYEKLKKANTVHKGILGSGDFFTKEADRVKWLHEQYGHLSEDMESFAVYRTCNELDVPAVAIRIIANDEVKGIPYDEVYGRKLQEVIWDIIKLEEKIGE
ncbi:MAG: 5'-methylthioadenosine/S-adenosylhomocysteine nucleosidase [Eubacterium sp.]|nr:5'-methylthioadenosine/S-adenosylhomocysteine nucleosidase [Eubacterium sp.]